MRPRGAVPHGPRSALGPIRDLLDARSSLPRSVNSRQHVPFYQLSYTHPGRSTTRFIGPGYVAQIKKELASYKRIRAFTQKWVALAVILPQLYL